MILEFLQRNLIYPMGMPPGSFTIERYSKAAVGGPKGATIRATGKKDDLVELLYWLRCGVRIWTDDNLPAWWGYVHAVNLTINKVVISVSLDELFNRAAVAFTLVGNGQSTTGVRGTTAWVEDEDSIREIGIRELLESLSGTTPTMAAAFRDRLLADKKYARAEMKKKPGGGDQTATCELVLRGWWGTLDWRYATVPTQLALAYDTLGQLGYEFGTTARTAFAQTFRTGAAAINLLQAEVYVRKTGSPTDDLKVSIFSVDGVDPDEELASGELAGELVASGSAVWTRFTFAEAVELTDGTTYSLVLSRSGDADDSDCYAVRLNENLTYADGVLREQVGGTWQAFAASDMPFRLFTNAIIENTTQVKALITSYGQFFKQLFVDEPSGLESESFRNGDSTAQFEVEQLLEGGSSNYRRMLAEVDANRAVRIYEQPAVAEGQVYSIRNDGEIYDPYGTAVRKDICGAGFWAQPADVLTTAFSRENILGFAPFFIEEVEYTPGTGELTFQSSEARNVFDLGGQSRG